MAPRSCCFSSIYDIRLTRTDPPFITMSDDKQLHGFYRIFPVEGDPSCLTAIYEGEPLILAPPSRAENQVWEVRCIEEKVYHILNKENRHLGASTFPDARVFSAVRLLDRLSAFRIFKSDGAEEFL